jgi:hypothetical protein
MPGELVRTTLSLDTGTVAKLDKLAEVLGMSRSGVITYLASGAELVWRDAATKQSAPKASVAPYRKDRKAKDEDYRIQDSDNVSMGFWMWDDIGCKYLARSWRSDELQAIADAGDDALECAMLLLDARRK